MKCQHEWVKLVEVTLPSGYEQMEKGGLHFETMKGVTLFQKKYILVVFCSKCGRLKKFVEANPE